MAAWTCSRCTLENAAEATSCEVCLAERPGLCAAADQGLPSAPPLPPPSDPPTQSLLAAMAPAATAPAATAPPLETVPGGYLQQAATPVPTTEAAQVAPSAPAAPMIAVWAASPKVLAKCAWLSAEALRMESRAADLDRAGNVAEALFHHRRATVKLAEAAAAFPEGHPDKATLQDYATDIQLRTVYLEGLGTALPSLPLDEHVAEIELTMDLAGAKAPEEDVQDIAGIVARTGASGSTSALTEDGYQLVAALKGNDEMKVFIGRFLESCGRRVRAGAEGDLEGLIPDFSGVRQTQSLARLQEALLRTAWVELVLDPKKDRLELAMDLEKEARRFESLGMRDQATDMYKRSVAILQFIINRDERMKNAKIKEMVTKRLADLEVQAAQLLLQM